MRRTDRDELNGRLTVGETKVLWRGRVCFRQCVPGKDHKYEVKMYTVADTNKYTWDFIMHTDKQHSMNNPGHAQTVIMQLLEGLFLDYRTATADKLFTSIVLAKR